MMIRFASATVALSLLAVAPIHAENAPLQLQPSKKALAAQSRQVEPLSPAEVVAKANDYLNGAQTMITDFVQIGDATTPSDLEQEAHDDATREGDADDGTAQPTPLFADGQTTD